MENKHKELKIDISKVFDEHGVKYRENTNQLIMDTCYNCGRSKKLYVNKETGVYLCFRCEEKGNPVKLFAKYLNISFKEAAILCYGKDSEKIYASPKALEEEENAEPFVLSLGGLQKLKKRTQDLEIPPLDLPYGLKPLSPEMTEPWQYLKKRGYSDDDIFALKLLALPYKSFQEAWSELEKHFGKDKKDLIKKSAILQGRIVFPVYVEHQIVGYVARDYTGEKEPKVLNSTGNFRSFSVWNFDNAKDSEELIICEGTTSAVKCGIKRSIALLGKMASPGQIKLIRKMNAKKVYICLDIGTDNEQDKLYKSMAGFYPGKIFKIELPPIIDNKPNYDLTNIDINKINQELNISLYYLADTNQFRINYEDKENCQRLAGIESKRSSEEKKTLMHKFLNKTNKFSSEEIAFLLWLIFKGEYKDSGDYSLEEMESFIKQAKVFSSGPRL